MTPYSILIERSLKGDTPGEKFDSLLLMKDFLKRIAYPQAGTPDWNITIGEIAEEIQGHFSLEDLEWGE